MKIAILTLSTLTFLSTTAFAETKPTVPVKEASQIFKAVGFSKTKHGWEGNCYTGEITIYKDLNGDGLKTQSFQTTAPCAMATQVSATISLLSKTIKTIILYKKEDGNPLGRFKTPYPLLLPRYQVTR